MNVNAELTKNNIIRKVKPAVKRVDIFICHSVVADGLICYRQGSARLYYCARKENWTLLNKLNFWAFLGLNDYIPEPAAVFCGKTNT